ncbi:Peptidyl-prolyl cis-trans isomerase [Oopsacas minuta]|uniref:peptidylprolyl isomerase n=1 Tax=Oopsacas minuta TaxID=111878 RepID=A0AAV7KBR7_9METZ|nr:Peptidyl-prolyl cis-trans isomerase [Oopsacas minuta]
MSVTSPDVISISSPISPTSSKPTHELPGLIESNAQINSRDIPKYNPIRVGTLVAVNYAGYYLPPWCYFREKWSPTLRTELRKTLEQSELPGDVVMKGMGEGDKFLNRSHEFQYYNKPDNTYHYLEWKKEYAHYVDTWMKFASNDNDELSPPTMNEDHFVEIKTEFNDIIHNYNKNKNKNKNKDIPPLLNKLTEFEFNKSLDNYKHQLPSDEINQLLDKINRYRWKQEEVLIREIHRRIDSILTPDSTEFRSVLERRVEYDKEVDRVVRGLYAYRMRFEVRLSEIEDIKTYLGLKEIQDQNNQNQKKENTLVKVLNKLEKIKDISKDQNEINRLRNYCLKTDGAFLFAGPRQEIDYPDFRDLMNDLAPLFKYFFDQLKTEIKTIFDDNNPDDITWDKYKDEIMSKDTPDKIRIIQNITERLRAINIEKVQEEDEKLNIIKQRVECVKKRVKQKAQQLLCEVDKLVKDETNSEKHKITQKQLQDILEYSREKVDSPFSVDDLNIYLRYPPIQNKLVLHEGYWPPLRAVPSEDTISVLRMGPPGMEYQKVKLSNVIARFDEAFSLFSSTLADHGMCRPTPQPRPMKFRYGLGEVVPAWDHGTKGISDMKLGEIRIIVCPSITAYGSRGVPDSVPPYMPLIYVIRMEGIYNKQDDIYESDDDIPSDQLDSQVEL